MHSFEKVQVFCFHAVCLPTSDKKFFDGFLSWNLEASPPLKRGMSGKLPRQLKTAVCQRKHQLFCLKTKAISFLMGDEWDLRKKGNYKLKTSKPWNLKMVTDEGVKKALLNSAQLSLAVKPLNSVKQLLKQTG